MEIQYTRNDIDFETWYSSWMKQLAKSYTIKELEAKLYGAKSEAENRLEIIFGRYSALIQ